MPSNRRTPPKYRLQKSRGLAVVTLNGKDHYLGRWQSEESYREYDRLIAEWLAAGRTVPDIAEQPRTMTVEDVIAAFWVYAKLHYRKNGEPTKELDNLRYAARVLRKLYGTTEADDFGPKALKVIQQELIRQGNSRNFINSQIGRIKRIFRWAVSEELVRPDLAHALSCVRGLQRGRSEARETAPVAAVGDEVVAKTIAHMTPVVADLVQFQRLTGCRPTEACAVRPKDLDRSHAIWRYHPESHKTD
ncbi:MAG: hypothetical protein KDB23_11900, partial [Planctomycetales bacterium]|nr:hypothetical protein [Planctomycetales bacterium]